jgi:tRNA uridine 5-carboxymethylaminomethyl modification enzyme
VTDLIDPIDPFKRFLKRIPKERFDEILESAEILVKYSGYIDREKLMADKFKRMESINIEDRFDYESLHSISTEARQKLSRIRPKTIGQASRISGVSPSDINVLLIMLGR